MYEAYHHTPVGFVRIRATDDAIIGTSIRDEAHEEGGSNTPLIQAAITQLDEYFAGTRREFDLPLDQPGSDFQKLVWNELIKVPYGTTISYLEQSRRMNNPLAIRAIAAANGKNNLWIVVPCHRIVGSNGTLTGYAGGLWRKQWLLDHEARVAGVGQAKLFF